MAEHIELEIYNEIKKNISYNSCNFVFSENIYIISKIYIYNRKYE